MAPINPEISIEIYTWTEQHSPVVSGHQPLKLMVFKHRETKMSITMSSLLSSPTRFFLPLP